MDPLDAALDLMRRLPPLKAESTLAQLIDLAPALTESLLSTIDQPLQIQRDTTTGRDYLLCDYNRDGDSYRSPWSSTYFPSLEDEGAQPSKVLRALEVQANEAFDIYRDLYYEGGLSSVYMWDLEDGFAAVVLFKKVGDGVKKMKGAWDAIHVIEAQQRGGLHAKGPVRYKLTSTVMLYLLVGRKEVGQLNLSGSLTRQMELEGTVNEPSDHLVHLGRLVEEHENKIRGLLQEIYFGKTRDVVNDLRSVVPQSEEKKRAEIQRQLVTKMAETRRA